MNFIKDNLILIVLALVSGGALLIPALQRRGAKVSHLQATQLINQGKTVILDVRDAEEFAAGHIQNAVHIPLKELETRIKELDKAKKQTVLAVCETGVRSATASGVLRKAGFENVVSLDGGLADWKSQGLPTVKTVK